MTKDLWRHFDEQCSITRRGKWMLLWYCVILGKSIRLHFWFKVKGDKLFIDQINLNCGR